MEALTIGTIIQLVVIIMKMVEIINGITIIIPTATTTTIIIEETVSTTGTTVTIIIGEIDTIIPIQTIIGYSNFGNNGGNFRGNTSSNNNRGRYNNNQDENDHGRFGNQRYSSQPYEGHSRNFGNPRDDRQDGSKN